MRQRTRCTVYPAQQNGSDGLVNIVSSTPMEILCLDYLKLESSKGGEDVLVITPEIRLLEQRPGYCSVTQSCVGANW